MVSMMYVVLGSDGNVNVNAEASVLLYRFCDMLLPVNSSGCTYSSNSRPEARPASCRHNEMRVEEAPRGIGAAG